MARAQSRPGITRIEGRINGQSILTGKPTSDTIHNGMDLVIHLVARIAVPLFFIGMAGSAFVVAATFIEDLQNLLEEDEE
jgi:hypothetical protein